MRHPRRRRLASWSFHTSNTGTPVPAKSATFLVTTVRPWCSAVAAMRPSTTPSSPPRRSTSAVTRPQIVATVASIGRMRSALVRPVCWEAVGRRERCRAAAGACRRELQCPFRRRRSRSGEDGARGVPVDPCPPVLEEPARADACEAIPVAPPVIGPVFGDGEEVRLCARAVGAGHLDDEVGYVVTDQGPPGRHGKASPRFHEERPDVRAAPRGRTVTGLERPVLREQLDQLVDPSSVHEVRVARHRLPDRLACRQLPELHVVTSVPAPVSCTPRAPGARMAFVTAPAAAGGRCPERGVQNG